MNKIQFYKYFYFQKWQFELHVNVCNQKIKHHFSETELINNFCRNINLIDNPSFHKAKHYVTK